MLRSSVRLALFAGLWLVVEVGNASALEARAEAAIPLPVRAVLMDRCVGCHSGETPAAGLKLDELPFPDADHMATLRNWLRIQERVVLGEMPPVGETPLSHEDRASFQTDLDSALVTVSREAQSKYGRVSLRRLTRTQYETFLHDLLGVKTPVQAMLPEDPITDGFDTVAEGLRFSPLWLEAVMTAADAALNDAISLGPKPESHSHRYSFLEMKNIRENLDTPEGKVTDPVSGNKHHIIFKELPDALALFSDSYSPTDVKPQHHVSAGRYKVRISAYGYQSHGRDVTLRLYSDDYRRKRLLGCYDFPAETPRVLELELDLTDGERLQLVPYNTGYDDNGDDIWKISGPQFTGVGLAVQWVELEGPMETEWPRKNVANLFPGVPLRELPANKRPWKHGKQRAYELAPEDIPRDLDRVIAAFAGRAFRRPLRDGELEPFTKLARQAVDDKQEFEDACRVAFRAILTSPQCLTFDEQPGKLDSHSLASRLSFFLTGGPPDEELLSHAAAGRLQDDAVLKSEVRRLLDHPSSARFRTDFAAQWLELRRIDATSPDHNLYPEFDEVLRLAMLGETHAYITKCVRENLDLSHLIDSPFVMVNSRLAEHYGVPNVHGEEFRAVEKPADSPRGGLLTQASILKVTANGTVTSPVVRGAWVLKRIYAQPSPPPPPITAIEPDTRGATTIRELLDKHRHTDACAVCHRKIDPPGFALENFDVIGGWRTRYRSVGKGDNTPEKRRNRGIWQYKLGPEVDPSGQLAEGQAFQDIRTFKTLLAAQQRMLDTALAGQLLTYGTGAAIQPADLQELAAIVDRTTTNGHGFRTLIEEVVMSETFRKK